MTSSRVRRSKASRHNARKAPAHRRATRHQDAAVALETTLRTSAEAEALVSLVREANERLILAAVRAENLSDEAHAETVQARADFERLMRELQAVQQRLTAATRQAHAMAKEARRRQEEYQRLSQPAAPIAG